MLRHDADAYVFNGGKARTMLDACRGWWLGPRKSELENLSSDGRRA